MEKQKDNINKDTIWMPYTQQNSGQKTYNTRKIESLSVKSNRVASEWP